MGRPVYRIPYCHGAGYIDDVDNNPAAGLISSAQIFIGIEFHSMGRNKKFSSFVKPSIFAH